MRRGVLFGRTRPDAVLFCFNIILLPDWLILWGTLVTWLLCRLPWDLGGYGTYLGFRIVSQEEKAKAKALHPNFLEECSSLLLGLLAESRLFSLLINPFLKGFIGLTLLTVQTTLSALFEGNPGLRNVHRILGSGIMAFFLVHAELGLQLGLSD